MVGVDGSPASREALEWAADEARRRGCDLEVVHSWSLPFFEEAYVEPSPAVEAKEKETLEAEVEATSDRLAGLEVNPRLVYGSAAGVLVDASKGAELLVVGSRGRGGFAGLLLGSVSQECASHASCPVAIVRNERSDDQ